MFHNLYAFTYIIYRVFIKLVENKNSRPSIYQSKLSHSIISFLTPPTLIIDNIYLSSCLGASNSYLLSRYNIKYIINLATTVPNFFSNMEYLKIDIKDDGQKKFTKQTLDKAYDFIEYSQLQNKNILIHCFMGRSRSVTVIIYYLMKKFSLNYDQAIDIIKNQRNYVNPSQIFKENIKELF